MTKFLIAALILLAGCQRVPGRVTGVVTKKWDRYPIGAVIDTRIEIFSDKYGNIGVTGSPYYDTVSINDKLILGCDDTDGKASGCSILGRLDGQEAKTKNEARDRK